jgi:signal transduction histidine kinase
MRHAHRPHTILRELLISLALISALLLTLPAASAAAYGKHLLVLNSYSPGYKWTEEIIAGITEAVREGDRVVRIHHEFMDTKRISDAGYFRLLYELYRYKFRYTHFDAIITSDNDAFDFMVQYRDRLFPGTPVVFCGVNNFDPSQTRGEKQFTGVNEAPNLRANLDLALKLQPETRRIVVINDDTTTGRAVHKQLMRILPAYQHRVRFELLEQTDMPAILATVQRLEPGDVVFFIFFFRDKNGNVYEFDQSVSLIAQHSPVPVYAVWDFNLGYGIVGGMLTSGYKQGEFAGEIAMRVLHGESADKIPVVMNSPNRYMFDYRQLRRFKIPLSELPPGSEIINRPLNRYSLDRRVIWGALSALAALMLIILVLLHNVSVKRRDESRLRELNEELEKRVRQRTEELERQNLVLQETYHGLQVETEERLRVMEELRMNEQLLIHQSRMAAMGEMLGNIAHQWRQPLNLLGLKIQDLGLSYKMGRFSKELLEENVSKVMEILRHLSRTIDDFRNFSTPDKQKVLFKVDEVIDKTVSLIGENFRGQGIELETRSDGEPEIYGYPNEYAQVLMNILMNARDALQDGKIAEGRIIIYSRTENGRTVVTISDNAGGIDEALLDKIFDAYFTTKELGKGTGVGLFMSKAIIEKNMGGHLTVRNIAGGAEFRITI